MVYNRKILALCMDCILSFGAEEPMTTDVFCRACFLLPEPSYSLLYIYSITHEVWRMTFLTYCTNITVFCACKYERATSSVKWMDDAAKFELFSTCKI